MSTFPHFPDGSIPLSSSSGTIAANTATATLAPPTGRTAYICGFIITSTGSTGAAVVAPTITGPIGGTMTFAYATVAGATLSNQPLIVNFSTPIAASTFSTDIVVSMGTLGLGNTNATVNAWGYAV